MFRTEKHTNGNQANEPANNQTPPANWPQHGSPYETPPYAQPAPPQSASVSRAITESDALARDIKEGVLNGFIGNGTTFTGEASFKGMLRVDGQVTGRITSEDGTLIVGNNGHVDANIEVAVATIHGTVNGDIIASKRIEIGRTSRVIGNIQAPTLVIEQGAVFEGTCRMLQLKQEADKKQEKKAAVLSATDKESPVETVSSVAS
jgi:cytoskeletal protein CcmA (bactofilin family)